MDKEILTEISGTIGKVEEVGTDANGEVMGQIIQTRVSVEITKPLTKVTMLEAIKEQNETQEYKQINMHEDTQGETAKEKEQIPITVQYKKLPEFCYCCGCIGHQYREYSYYKNLSKKEPPYGLSTKAQTTTKRMKQKKDRGKYNAILENPRDESQSLAGIFKITVMPILTIAEKLGLDTKAT